jgi:streptogramin lyase
VRRYDGQTGGFIDVFVASGSGGLSYPTELTFGADGNLYVSSSATDQVLRYDGTTGAFVDAFVTAGSGGLNTPTGLIFGPDGNLYVSSNAGDAVLRYAGASGAFIDAFVTAGSGGLDAPRGIVFGPDGHFYVAEQYHDSVSRYDGTTGAFIDVFVPAGAGGLDRANDVLFDFDDDLLVASLDGDQVLRYDGTTGDFLGVFAEAGLNGPAWLATSCDPAPTAVSQATAGATPEGVALAVLRANGLGGPARFRFELPVATRISLAIHDVTGRRVRELAVGTRPAGAHVIDWDFTGADGRRLAGGVYFARLAAAGEVVTRKVVHVR